MAEQQIYSEVRDQFLILDDTRGVVVRELRIRDEGIPDFSPVSPAQRDAMTVLDTKNYRGDITQPPLPATHEAETAEQQRKRIEEADERVKREAKGEPDNTPGGPHNPRGDQVPNRQVSDRTPEEENRRMAREHAEMSEKTVPDGRLKEETKEAEAARHQSEADEERARANRPDAARQREVEGRARAAGHATGPSERQHNPPRR